MLTSGWHLQDHPEMHNAVHELTAPGGGISSQSRKTDGAVRDGQKADRKEFLRKPGLDRLDDATAEQLLEEPEPEPGGGVEQEQRREFLKDKGAVSRVRGMLLGLALGDTLGAARGKLPAHGLSVFSVVTTPTRS
ncbi:hypothetical protein ABZ904_49845 [Streptomyces sp. NPDC046900]|uniref:hypothetical protein n=1 Tax=Streptomyces sp. NPDC046900 TaxID=3155473 RepID=UPI00340F6256